MKAAVWYGSKDIRIEDVPEPQTEAGQVKVKIKFCGICGSDLHEYASGPFIIPAKEHPLTGRKGGPVILGHEFSGEVVAVGEGVTTVQAGNRVTVNPLIYCGECQYCRRGNHLMCSKLATVGFAWDGAFAEYGVFPEYSIIKIPDHLNYETAACVEPLAVAVHAVNRSGLRIGDNVAVIGAGPIGLMVQQACKAAGAGRVFVSEPMNARIEMAKIMGANAVLNPTEMDIGKEISRLTDGLRADIAFDCVGTKQTFESCVKATGRRAKICVVGLAMKPIEVAFMRLWAHEKELTFSQGYDGEFPAAINFLADGRVKVDDFITKIISLDDFVERGIKGLLNDPDKNVKILVKP